MARRRAFDWVLIVALTGAWAVLFVRGIGEGLRTQRGFIDVRVSSARAGDYPIAQDGPAGNPEIRPGDRVIAVDGEDLRGGSQLHFYDLATRGARERGFTILRADRDGTAFDVRVALTPRPGWWLAFVMQALGMAVALTIILRASNRRLARLLFVSMWLWIAFSAAMDGQQGWRGTRGEVALGGALSTCFSILTVWTAQEFTRSARPVPGIWRALALGGGVLVAATFGFRISVPHTWAQIVVLLSLSWVSIVSLTLAGLSRAYRLANALERRQIRWVMLGFYVAFIGNFAALELTLAGARMLARVSAPVATTALYAGILVAVIGYRWLDVDRLISASASYTIVGVSALGASLAFAPRIASAAAPALGVDAGVVQWVLTMVFVLAAVPAHLALRPWLERGLFAERGRRIAALERLVDEVRTGAGAEELWRLASAGIDAALDPSSLVVYAREGDAFVVRFARGRDPSAPYDASSMLVHALERRSRPLAANASELDAFDHAALATLGVALIVPVHAGERLIAFACLGPKRSGDIYTSEEKAQLAALAARCGSALRPAPDSAPQVFRRDGGLWTIASRGKEIHLRDMRGLHYLATLLREPGREFAALDLVRAASGLASVNGSAPDPELRVVRRLGDAGAVLDIQARNEYRARLSELEEELADAERCADLGRLERASTEREALLDELEASGRGRTVGSDAERARIAVTKTIKVALERIAEAHPELGAHLVATVRRGHVCAYDPDPRAASSWEV